MARPLMQHGIGELENMFATRAGDTKVLRQLELELSYRQVPRAYALAEKVATALRTDQPSPATPPKQHSTGELHAPPLESAAPVFAPAKSTQPASALPAEPRLALAVAAFPAVSLEEAYRALGVAPSSTWEQVEQARRQLVDQAHPSKVARLTPERRAQAQSSANRANAAYAALAQARSS